MYVEQNMTMKEISQATGMGWRSVQRRLKKEKVTINPLKRKKAERPKIKGKFVYTYVAEKKYGRTILPNEIVHHLDFDHNNNHPDNLVIVTRSKHNKLHWNLQRLAVEFYKQGIIKFDEEKMKYVLQ